MRTDKCDTCPMMTSETSVPFNPARIRLSLITILPSSDAFREDKDPQSDPLRQNKIIDTILHVLMPLLEE